MKRILLYLLIAAVLVGCSDSYSGNVALKPTLSARYMNVTPNELTFNAEQASAQTLNIMSAGTPWKIENGLDWVNLSKHNGNSSTKVAVNVDENIDCDKARTGVFYIKSDVDDWNYEKGVSVYQSSAEPHIVLSQHSAFLKGMACSVMIGVSSNCSYEVKNESTDWLTITKKEDGIVLNATANTTDSYRNATVRFVHSVDDSEIVILGVTQAPASITASTDALEFDNTAGVAKIKIDAEAEWAVSVSDSWIDVSPEKGAAGSSYITVSVSPNTYVNERTGYLVLSVGASQKIQIPVKQRGIYIGTDKQTCEFENTKSSQTLQIISNTSWQITSVSSWITVDKTSGEGNSDVNVTAEDNPNTTERNGEFVVSQPDLTARAVVKVHQKGKSFSMDATVLAFSDKSATTDVSVYTDGAWRAYTSADWITVSPNSATGNAVLNISVSENKTDGERNGNVVVMMGDASATISVVQKGKYFALDNSILDFTSKGGTLDVSLTTNAPWTARKDGNADWIKLSQTSGNENANVTVVAADNPSMKQRTANIYFDAVGRDVSILITQKPRFLTVDANEILFYAKGGTSNTVAVSTDGQYSISCSGSWFSINRNGNTFTVTTSENTGKEPRLGIITISLTDLKEGTCTVTLPVTQLNYGGTFLRKDYDGDNNYDSNTSASCSLTITSYGSDTNYDTSGLSGTKLSVVSYKPDVNLDSSTSSSAKSRMMPKRQ